MREFAVVPHEGVGPVEFGMARSQVQSVLGPCISFMKAGTTPTDAWFENSFQVFYSPDQTVEYIELSRSDLFTAKVFGVAVLEISPAEALRKLDSVAQLAASDPVHGDSYLDRSLDLSIWRPGKFERRFMAVGVGRRGYFADAV